MSYIIYLQSKYLLSYQDVVVRSIYSSAVNASTLESGIDIGQGITIGPGKFVKKNKRRALNKRRA